MRHASRSIRPWRAAVLGFALVMAPMGAVQASGPVVRVTGSYTYIVVEGRPGRAVTVDAHGTDPIRGTWSFQALPAGVVQSGSVTCLVVEGDDAFMFGPATVGGRAAFLWVRDGGAPGGADDQAITWMQDLPTDDLPPGLDPQTLDEMEDWCESARASYPGIGPIPLASGNLTIHDGS